MPQRPLQAAIIGCGSIAPTHVEALALDGRSELAWACDSDLLRAKALGRARRISADWREVLADPALDLVIITTPHHLHVEPFCAAIAAGKQVICEKPLATNPGDLKRMVDAAAASARMTSGIFQHRFNPLVQRLHTAVRHGDFGAVRSARIDFRCTRSTDYYASAPWRGTWDGEGGGVLINQAIHTIDLMTWFCGSPIAVTGRIERRRLGSAIEVEDWAQATVHFAGGADGDLTAANDGAASWQTDLVVTGELGSFALGTGYGLVRIDHPSRILANELATLSRIRDEVVQLPGKDCYGDHHALQIADCVGAALNGHRPAVSIADAAVTNQVVLGIYASAARDGMRVALPLNTGDYRRPDPAVAKTPLHLP